MSFTVAQASDLAAIQLNKYIMPDKPEDIFRHLQNRPLLRTLNQTKKEYGSGLTYVREGVQGAMMKDQPGSYQGISGDDVLTFTASSGAIQTQFPIRWMHAGFKITLDELLAAGVHVEDNGNNVTATKDEATVLLDLLKTRLFDFSESRAINSNLTLWLDGSQDAKSIPGIKSIITDDPTTGLIGGIDRAANTWWRHICRTGVGGALPTVGYSKADQTLTETMLKDLIQLGRFGGKVDVMLAGSDFIDAVNRECRAKGTITMTGWADKKTNVDVNGVKFGSVAIEYDPTLDDLGEAKSCYAWDSNHLRLRPQKKEWNKVTNQNQPADQFIMLKSVTDRGALSQNQPDSSAKWVLA